MASNITVDTLTKGSTTLNTDEIVDTNSSQVCKAWVNFNGTGTVAIRDSYNVSSITDLGTGGYQVNITNAISNANYTVTSSSNREFSTSYPLMVHTHSYSTTSYRVGHVRYDNGTWVDTDISSTQVFSN